MTTALIARGRLARARSHVGMEPKGSTLRSIPVLPCRSTRRLAPRTRRCTAPSKERKMFETTLLKTCQVHSDRSTPWGVAILP